jgi:hypothetical protein
MKYINSQNPFEKKTKKSAPTGLKTLCILTFIASGLLAICYFFYFAVHDMMLVMLDSGAFDKLFNIYPEEAVQSFERLLLLPKTYFLLYSLVLAGSVIGAVFMLRLKIVGFHIYILSKIAAFSIEWFLFKTGFSIIPLVVAVVFIYLYFRYLKFMKPAEENSHVNPENDDEPSEN